MPTRRPSVHTFQDLQREMRSLRSRIRREHNISSPTMPLYASTGMPDDAIEGQYAIAESLEHPGHPTVWFYYDGQWREICAVCAQIITELLVVHDVDFNFSDPERPWMDFINTLQIAKIALDGSEEYVKEDHGNFQTNYCQSWDGTKIAFERFPTHWWDTGIDQNFKICVMGMDGSDETVLYDLGSSDELDGMSFSPDGTMLAFTTDGFTDPVKVIDATTGTLLGTCDDAQMKQWAYNLTWTMDNCLVGYLQDVFSDPFVFRKWNPVTDVYTTVFDFQAYAIANGYDPTIFQPYDTIDINQDNVLVCSLYNVMDTGQVVAGSPIMAVDPDEPILAFINCTTGTMVSLIDAGDMPDWGWEIYHRVGSYTPAPVILPSGITGQPVLDTFTQADGAISGSWTIVSGSISTLTNRINAFQTGLAYYNAIGPFDSMDVSIKTASVGGSSDTQRYELGVRMQTNGDGIYCRIRPYFGSPPLYWREFYVRNGGVDTMIGTAQVVTINNGSFVRFRVAGNTISAYVNSSFVGSFTALSGELVHTNGYIGLRLVNSPEYLDDFSGREVTYTQGPTDYYDYMDYETPDQIWWSNDNEQIMWHNEVPVPPDHYGGESHDFFREWQALAMKPDTTNFWTFQFAPDGETGTVEAFTEYAISEATPPYADSAYIPTWTVSNLVALTADNNGYMFESFGWDAVAARAYGEEPYWLHPGNDVNEYPFVRPTVWVRYGLMGSRQQSWFMDQTIG